jgi:hypothetical protein
MPWRETSAMDERLRFVQDVHRPGLVDRRAVSTLRGESQDGLQVAAGLRARRARRAGGWIPSPAHVPAGDPNRHRGRVTLTGAGGLEPPTSRLTGGAMGSSGPTLRLHLVDG